MLYKREDYNITIGRGTENILAILGLLINGYCTVPRLRMYWEESTDSHNVAIVKVIDLKKCEICISMTTSI